MVKGFCLPTFAYELPNIWDIFRLIMQSSRVMLIERKGVHPFPM